MDQRQFKVDVSTPLEGAIRKDPLKKRIYGAGKSRVCFRWVKAPTSEELTRLTHTIAQRIARYLERQGFSIRVGC